MLAKFYRFRAINNTGQTITFNTGVIAVRWQGWKIASGELSFEAAAQTSDLNFDAGRTIINGADVMNDASIVESAVIQNGTDLFFGINGTFTVTHDLAAADGSFDLYIETSDEDGNWPSDSDDFIITDLTLIASLSIANTGVTKSRSKNFRYQ